jgi:hypothetical protein
MSNDLLATAGAGFVALTVWFCWVRAMTYYEPRGKHPRRHLHGTPYKGRVRRG